MGYGIGGKLGVEVTVDPAKVVEAYGTVRDSADQAAGAISSAVDRLNREAGKYVDPAILRRLNPFD